MPDDMLGAIQPAPQLEQEEMYRMTARADKIMGAFAKSAMHARLGERLPSHRLHTLQALQPYSSSFAAVRLDSTTDPALLATAERTIWQEAELAAARADANSGKLRRIVERDSSGREIIKYAGDIAAAFAPWMRGAISVRILEPEEDRR